MKVGIVGAGSMGNAHSAGWKHMEDSGVDVQLVGIMARNPESAKPLAEQHNIEVYDNYDALVNDVDIISICTPTNLHKDMVLKAAKAGKHIVCEKPIALSVADGRAMIDACNDAGVRLFLAMVVRFIPEYRNAYNVIADGAIGKPSVIRLTRVSYQPFKADDNWFVDEERSGGMVTDLMIHDFDYARWIGGNVKRVFAKSVRASRKDAPGDYALVSLRFVNGAMAHIEGGWAYPPGHFRAGYDIAGTEGVIESNIDKTNPLHVFLKDEPETEVSDVAGIQSAVAESPYTIQLQHFYDSLVNDTPFDVTAEDSLAALQIALAVRESLKTGKAVTINQEGI